MSLARTAAILLSASALLAACAGGPFDTGTGVRSMCDVPFEEGRTMQVSGVFAGRGKVWQADYNGPFDDKYADVLELGSSIVIDPAYRHFRIEVEGRLYIDHDGKPGIEFLKLGKIVERLKEPERCKEAD